MIEKTLEKLTQAINRLADAVEKAGIRLPDDEPAPAPQSVEEDDDVSEQVEDLLGDGPLDVYDPTPPTPNRTSRMTVDEAKNGMTDLLRTYNAMLTKEQLAQFSIEFGKELKLLFAKYGAERFSEVDPDEISKAFFEAEELIEQVFCRVSGKNKPKQASTFKGGAK